MGSKWRKVVDGKLSCGACKQLFPATAEYFYEYKGAVRKNSSRFFSRCKTCCLEASARRDKEEVAWSARVGRFRRLGILVTEEDYQLRLAAQNGVCYICKLPPKEGTSLAIDHDHRTGKLRKLLCGPCNLLIGRIEARPEMLEYIKEHSN
jgi:hypothetical protein